MSNFNYTHTGDHVKWNAIATVASTDSSTTDTREGTEISKCTSSQSCAYNDALVYRGAWPFDRRVQNAQCTCVCVREHHSESIIAVCFASK